MSESVIFNNEVLNATVHKVLRTAAMLSYGTMVLPYAVGVERSEVRAARAPPLKQWFLEKDGFEQQVAQQYDNLTAADVREVVAPTGVGKSTKLAYVIASTHKVNGIVLTPNDVLPAHLIKYVRTLYTQLGGEVSVAILRTAHLTTPVQSPCVYYASGSTFLSRLAIRPTLLEELGVDFIYLDESHERVPAYLFFRYLLTANLVGSVKVFYGTATGATDMVERKDNVIAVPEKDMSVSSPGSATTRSPLHYRNIDSPTMIVFALDSEIRMWADYYDEHDIPAYPCYMEDGLRPMNGIDEFLNSNGVCVVLVTSMYRTGFTYRITNVICTGYYAAIETDFTSGKVSIKRVPVTPSLRVQTMGRVDRIMPGKGVYADVQTSFESREMTDDVAFYVYLWGKVFNLRINDPVISAFADVTGELSRKTAAMLLHSRMPPALMLPYLGDTGFYKCWSRFAACMLYSSSGMDTVSMAPVNTDEWVSYSTGPVDYSNVPISFKSAVRFPREWQCLPALAWTNYLGSEAKLAEMRPRSVVSAVSTVMPMRKARASSLTVDSAIQQTSTRRPNVNKTLPTRPISQLPPLRESTDSIGVPAYSEVRDMFSVRDTIPAIETPPPRYKHVRTASYPEYIPQDYQPSHTVGIEAWQSEVASVRTARVGSDSSDEQHRITLRQVDPVKYRYCKLYPMDPVAFDLYTQLEIRQSADVDRANRLLTGARNISSIRGDAEARRDAQRKYFLSVIRVHNHAVSQKAQITSNVKMTPFEKLTMKLHGDVKKVDEDIEEMAKLLKAFMLESWFVGIDRRVPRSSDAGSDALVTPDHSHDEVRAKVMMAFGSTAVVDTMRSIATRSVPYVVDGAVVANAWVFEDNIITTSHVYESCNTLHQSATGIKHQPVDDDVVVFDSSVTFPNTVVMRTPEAVESVYFLTFDKMQRKVIVLGDYELYYNGGIAYTQCVLEKGHSGALAISVSDGALLGIYANYFDGDGVGSMSLVVPADKFMGLL